MAPELGVAQKYLSDGDDVTREGRLVGADSNLAAVWHQDDQFRRLPAWFSLLYCVATPPPGVADTVYACTRAAHATLPDGLRRQLQAHRWATHTLNTVAGVGDGTADAHSHPLELDGPCGASLYLGSRNARVQGLDAQQSLDLMDALIEHTTTASPLYAHAHEPGGLLIACNRVALHRATAGLPSRATSSADARHLVRVLVEEPAPLAVLCPGPGVTS